MTTQTQTHCISILELFTLILQRPDENFYEDEAQLAAELAASLPEGLAYQPLPDVEADEFETLYCWFLS